MGEKKRRERAGAAAIKRIAQELAEEGRLIEAGFAALAEMAIPKDAGPVQLAEMKLAYMAGAQHLFSSILGILDPGTEATPADLRCLDLIDDELEAWRATMAPAAAEPAPSAAPEWAAVPAQQRLGDAPIEEAYRGRMNELARVLDRQFNGAATGGDRKTGFVLLVFPFGDQSGRANFISNGDRRDIVTLFREMIARFEGQPEMSGRA